jgi:hypothetical protein
MKQEIIKLIKIYGMGYNEILIRMELSVGIFDSIEYCEKEDLILLHKFKGKYDFVSRFQDFPEEDKMTVLKYLAIIYN